MRASPARVGTPEPSQNPWGRRTPKAAAQQTQALQSQAELLTVHRLMPRTVLGKERWQGRVSIGTHRLESSSPWPQAWAWRGMAEAGRSELALGVLLL